MDQWNEQAGLKRMKAMDNELRRKYSTSFAIMKYKSKLH